MWIITFFVFCFLVGALIEYLILICTKIISHGHNRIRQLIREHSDPLEIVAFGVFILIIFAVLGSYIKESFLNTVVNTVFTGILVLATIVYTSLTSNILKDGQKARELEFIQKQLEYFYYPWLHVMKDIENTSLNFNRKKIRNDDLLYMDCLTELAPILRKGDLELHKYQYLTNDDIRGRLLKIEQYFGFKCMELDPAYIGDVTEIHQDDTGKYIDFIHPNIVYCEQENIFNELMSFKPAIESEIEMLNNKLIGLVK